MKIKISDITVKERIRKDMGSSESLYKSMEAHGLLNPITITEEHELLAGYRRLTAAKKLGWNEIECNIVKADTKLDKFLIEVEENTTRKDFDSDEMEYIEKEKEFLEAKGLQKLILIIKRWIERFLAWLEKLKSSRI